MGCDKCLNCQLIDSLRADIRQFEKVQKGILSGREILGYPPPPNAKIKRELKEVYRDWPAYKKQLNKLLTAVKEDKAGQYSEALVYIRAHTPPLVTKMDKAVDSWTSHTSSVVYYTLATELSLVLIALVIAVFASAWLARSIIPPLKQMADSAAKIGEGDLDQSVSIETNDELGKLATSFNRMADQLQATTVNRNYLDEILNTMSDMLIVFTCSKVPSGESCPAKIEEVNRAVLEKSKYEEHELTGERLQKICNQMCPIEHENSFDSRTDCFINKKISNYETTLNTKQGKEIPVLVSSEQMEEDKIVLVATDITKRKQAREELKQRERQFRQMAENFDEVFWMFDSDWKEVIYLDQDYEDLYGGRPEKVRNDPTAFLEDIHPEDRDKVKEAVEKLKQGEEVELEYRVNPGADFKRWVWVEGVPILNPDNEVTRIIGASREITDRKEMELQFQYGATHDLKTGLFNHAQFKEELKQHVSRADRYKEKLSVVMFDIDHFKSINDKYGHQKGDEVLEDTAQLLKELTRDSDLAARYGGEEFALILPQSDELEAENLAERIRTKFEETSLANLSEGITISGGIATYHQDQNRSGARLISRADEALYTAKVRGRNRVNLYSQQKT